MQTEFAPAENSRESCSVNIGVGDDSRSRSHGPPSLEAPSRLLSTAVPAEALVPASFSLKSLARFQGEQGGLDISLLGVARATDIDILCGHKPGTISAHIISPAVGEGPKTLSPIWPFSTPVYEAAPCASPRCLHMGGTPW